jgi:predicted TIM-barrel fold metal-dependent hydrolase
MGNVRRVVVPIAQRLTERSLHISIALEGNIPVAGGSTFLPLLVRDACPDACIVLDHCWLPSAWEDYLALAKDDLDLWFTLHSLPQALLTRVVRELGIERILVGSWLPETDPDLILLQLKRATSMGVELEQTLTENAQRVLNGRPPKRRSP